MRHRPEVNACYAQVRDLRDCRMNLRRVLKLGSYWEGRTKFCMKHVLRQGWHSRNIAETATPHIVRRCKADLAGPILDGRLMRAARKGRVASGTRTSRKNLSSTSLVAFMAFGYDRSQVTEGSK